MTLIPKGYAGRGTVIAFGTDGVNFTAMPQLEKFERSGSKVDFDDITALDSPGNNKFPVAIVVDNGKYTADGAYDPQNPGIIALQGYMQAMQLIYYKITLIDGTTCTGQCYVSQFEAPKIDRYKTNRFSFEVMIYGVESLTPPGGAVISE